MDKILETIKEGTTGLTEMVGLYLTTNNDVREIIDNSQRVK